MYYYYCCNLEQMHSWEVLGSCLVLYEFMSYEIKNEKRKMFEYA